MFRLLTLGLMCGSLVLLCRPLSDRTARAQEGTRIAPASDGVEIEELHIVRWSALGAVKGADLTNMRLGLWFSADWKASDADSPPLIHLQELSTIRDDTGLVLSTEKRLKEIGYLRGEVRGSVWQISGGKQGPVARLVLEAPGRGAATIKSVKGKAQVTLTRSVDLTFKELVAVNGKELEHPDMKALAGMKLRFSIEEQEGRVSAKLSAPVNYASPWNRGRLCSWDVMDGKKRLRPASEGTRGEGEGVTVEKTYRCGTVKGLSLRLVVLEAVESKTFAFDFQNVELP